MTEERSIHSTIERYHQGLIENRPEQVTKTLGHDFIMFNGSFSSEPTDWEAHMFLTGPMLEEWPVFFAGEAGPYENEWEFLHTHIRGDAALVVTRETGKNRFRTWENEIVTWMLGRHAEDDWRIVGYFIRDIRNPE